MRATPPSTIALDAPPFRLRPVAEPDVGRCVALFTDSEVMRSVGPPFEAGRAARAALAMVAHQVAAGGRFRHWMIEHAHGTAGLLGLALRSVDWPGGEAELGVLLWPAWQARGAATAAVVAVRAWAFDVAALAVLTCHHAESHAAAAALMRRVGFTRCAPRADAPRPVGWECVAGPAGRPPPSGPLR
ncbi:hypothetical protein GCM10028794_08650 [Silanimonas algicola]